MRRTLLIPLLALLVCHAAPLHAQSPGKEAKAAQELRLAVERQVLGMNVNQDVKYLIDYHFSTFHGMYAYRELMQWAQAAPPPRREALMALVRAGLEAVVRDSGMGLPLGKDTGRAAGLLFDKGLPRYMTRPDFSAPATLGWDPASFERTISPAALGQSLAAKALFVQIERGAPDATRDLMLASALQEFQTLLALLERGGNAGARYMPAVLKLEAGNWAVSDASSSLHGQLSLLQGLAQLHATLARPELAAAPLAGKPAAEWRKDVRRTLERIFNTMLTLHRDARSGSLVRSHDPRQGAADRIGADEAGYALEVLADLVAVLPREDDLRNKVLRQLTTQADYLLTRLARRDTAPQLFLLGNDRLFDGMVMRLDDQLSLIAGLLATSEASGQDGPANKAREMYEAARSTFWSEAAGIFRSAAGQAVSAYDGHLFGLTLATWRRLEPALPAGEAHRHGEHHIEVVLRQGGLQQAEGPATGEPRQPEDFIRDELPELLRRIATLKKDEQVKKIAAAVKALSDQDNDGIPGCRFAGGAFGAAPVIITQTSVKTPFEKTEEAAP